MTAIIADQHCASWSVQDLLLQLSCGHAEIPAAPLAGSQPAPLRLPLRRLSCGRPTVRLPLCSCAELRTPAIPRYIGGGGVRGTSKA